jgi:hypothetical protein
MGSFGQTIYKQKISCKRTFKAVQCPLGLDGLPANKLYIWTGLLTAEFSLRELPSFTN